MCFHFPDFGDADDIWTFPPVLPIAIFHGSQDPIVPEVLGRQARDALVSQGFEPQYRNYPMDHSVHPQEIRDISTWLQNVLQPARGS